MQEKIPDPAAYPILGKKHVLRFSQEVNEWFNQRREVLSSLDMPHYFEQFSDVQDDFMSWFLPEVVRPLFSKEEQERRAKNWEAHLKKAAKIYQRAIEYLKRSGKLNTKPKKHRVRFDQKALVINYFDPHKDEWQEVSLTRNSISASICEKMYASCRQKGMYLTPKVLFEDLRKHQPKCRDWEPYDNDPIRHWKLLSDNVRSVNRRTKVHLFDCDADRVTRAL